MQYSAGWTRQHSAKQRNAMRGSTARCRARQCSAAQCSQCKAVQQSRLVSVLQTRCPTWCRDRENRDGRRIAPGRRCASGQRRRQQGHEQAQQANQSCHIGHREMRPIHLDRPRARLPVNSWSHEAPAPRLRPQWIHAPYAAARARGLAASRERRLGASSNPQNFSAVVFGRGFLLEVENTRPEKGFSARRHGKRTEGRPGRRNDTPPPSGRATTPRGTDTHRRRPDAPPNYGGKTGERGVSLRPPSHWLASRLERSAGQG